MLNHVIFQALKPKVRIEGGKELVYREGETATVFADVPSEPAADDIRWFGYQIFLTDSIASS